MFTRLLPLLSSEEVSKPSPLEREGMERDLKNREKTPFLISLL